MTNLNKLNATTIKITMTEENYKALKEFSVQLSSWHCAKGFLSDCISQMEHRIIIHKKGPSSEITLGSSTFEVLLTNQQIKYFKSEDAKTDFSNNNIAEEFYQQIAYKINKIHIA